MIITNITIEQIQLFMFLFRGRTDIYARYWERNGKSGYSPAYEFNWNEFMAFKARGGRLADFPNKKPLILTMETIRYHLEGKSTIGIYPLLKGNTSYFIAADFDEENWQKEAKEFIKTCRNYNISAYLERSRSGKGGHVWIFFEDKYPAYKSRRIVLELIRQALNLSQFEKEVSFDRLFPNQDYHTNQGIGNLIALPFQKFPLQQGNTAFLDPNSFGLVADQWKFIGTIQKVPILTLNELYHQLAENSNESVQKSNVKSLSSDTLQITVKNQIAIGKDKLDPQLVRFLREELNFFNTEYAIKKKIGVSTYQTEKYFRLIRETNDSVLLPRGFLNRLIDYCQNNEIPYVVNDGRIKLPGIKFKSKITLRDYQEEVLKEIEQDSGIIVAPSGSGKTILGLELITRRSQKALILVHRKQLLDQWVERIQTFLGIPKTHIGRISGIKKEIGKEITVAMMQSLIKMPNIEGLGNQFGTIIVDECHHIPAKTFRELISHFNPYYLYGLTATPKRKYNDEKLIYLYIGGIIATVNTNDTAPKNVVFDKQLQVYIKETDISVPFDYKTDEFETVSKILIYDNVRNNLICENVKKEVQAGKKMLILTERKEHVDVLNLYLKNLAEVITLTGEDSVSKRVVKVDQIKSGHFQILIATGQLFGEGMDFKAFNCLFLVYPFSFEGKLIQYIGRIQRSKSQKVIYDYRDKNIPFFERLFKNRLRYYKKMTGIRINNIIH